MMSGHFWYCLYGVAVGICIGILDVEVIWRSIPNMPAIRDTLLENGLDKAAVKGFLYLFSSFGFFTGSWTMLSLAGIIIFIAGLTNLCSVWLTGGSPSNRESYSDLDSSEIAV
jgi:hypothetical protein